MNVRQMSLKSLLLRPLRILPLLWIVVIFTFDPDVHVVTQVSLAIVALLFVVYRFDITNAWVAFAVPWFMILVFGTLGISEYSRDVSPRTITVVVSLIAIAAAFIPPVRLPVALDQGGDSLANPVRFRALVGVFLLLAGLNIAVAGYVPLIQLLLTGDSGYMGFGIKGVYGFFNAFSNALGITAFYLWMIERKNVYRNVFFLVIGIFLLFMTRQNIISLLVESFVVFNLIRKRVTTVQIVVMVSVTLFLFGVIGDLRVGKDITDLAKITDEYKWVPKAGIWMYAYFYFNLLNLDNAVNAGPPYLDFSSFSQIIPSFLRPASDHAEDLLEVSQFTVGSFVTPLYRDLGIIGLWVLFFCFCLGLEAYRKRIQGERTFVAITSYSVMYFCFMFSFFENFFFYLPVIFQLFFLYAFKKYLFVEDDHQRISA
jgi:oligosaccharide repeat unit polymerase